jgi:hypothetical protein
MYDAVHRSLVTYDALFLLVKVTFLLGVPLALVLRATRPRRMPWWLVLLVAAALGWLGMSVGAFVGNLGAEAWIEEQSLPRGPWDHEDHPRPLVDPWPPHSPVPVGWGCAVGIGYLLLLLGPWWVSRVLIRRARLDALFRARLRLALLSAGLVLAIAFALAYFSAT